jgi:hypothetical protein
LRQQLTNLVRDVCQLDCIGWSLAGVRGSGAEIFKLEILPSLIGCGVAAPVGNAISYATQNNGAVTTLAGRRNDW